MSLNNNRYIFDFLLLLLLKNCLFSIHLCIRLTLQASVNAQVLTSHRFAELCAGAQNIHLFHLLWLTTWYTCYLSLRRSNTHSPRTPLPHTISSPCNTTQRREPVSAHNQTNTMVSHATSGCFIRGRSLRFPLSLASSGPDKLTPAVPPTSYQTSLFNKPSARTATLAYVRCQQEHATRAKMLTTPELVFTLTSVCALYSFYLRPFVHKRLGN